MKPAIRSFTTRALCALFGAAALAEAAPATALADHRDDRGWRGERYYDHGGRHGWRGRDHGWDFRHGFRRGYAVHRHGPSCVPRRVYRYGYRPYHPYAAFYWSW